MTQETKPQPTPPGEPYSTRSAAEVTLLGAAVLAAMAASTALITRLIALAAPLWLAAVAGVLLSLIFVSTFVIAVGKSSRRILLATAVIILIVALLWSLPSKLRAGHHKHASRIKSHGPLGLSILYI